MSKTNTWKTPWMQEEHIFLQDSVRKFIEREITPNSERWRKQGVVDREIWKIAGEAGIIGAAMPEEFGGSGGDRSFDAILAYEFPRRGETDFGTGLGVQNICLHYVLAYGTKEQKHRWLPPMVSGELVAAIAMTEPNTGSDLQAIQTRAVRDGNSYVINGSKTFISNGQMAGLIFVVAKTGSEEGAKGISLVVLETAGAEGFRRGRNLEKLGLKAQDTSELFFDDVRVPLGNLLGDQEGQGFYQLMSQLNWERLACGVGAIGAMDAILTETLAYVQERKVFGKRIIDFQNTRMKLAEAQTKYEVTKAFVEKGLEELFSGTLETHTASMAKWWASQMQCEIVDECLQFFGGYGYMMEYPITRFYADARVQKIYGGANEIQKELIAKAMDRK
jgi:acyl-CoA dehydrogenase